jgi:DNA-binding transcriptional ArsR family regulator
MVNYRDEVMDAVFTALADSTRRGMIARLSKGPASIGELGRPYAITKPAVTKHVKLLERAGLIRREVRGRTHRVTLEPRAMQRAEDWIERYRKFWEASLDALADYVEKTKPKED